MIFREPLLQKVLSGEKTVTRRPVKFDSVMPVGAPGPVKVAHACRYKPHGGPGGTYALQGPPEKGSRARARTIPGYRLRVVEVHRGYISEGWGWGKEVGGRFEAEREGFADFEEFRRYWIDLYGSYNPAQLVDRIEFELVQLTHPEEER